MTNHLSIAHPKSFEVKGCQEDYHDKGLLLHHLTDIVNKGIAYNT